LVSSCCVAELARAFVKRNLGLMFASLFLALSSFAIQHQASRPIELDEPIAKIGQAEASFEFLENPKPSFSSSRLSAAIKLNTATLRQESIALVARGQLTDDKELAKFQRGDIASCRLEFRATLAGDRAGFRSRCVSALQLVQAATDAPRLINAFRGEFIKNLGGIDLDSAGLVAGLAIGDTSKLSAGLIADMKTVSLTHLTAVSGANCAIVLAIFYFLFKALGLAKWMRVWLSIGCLAGYVLLVGAQPSVIRAAVMAAMVLLSIGMGRKAKTTHALALATLVLLIADPWLAVDYGFALSVAATLGILLLTAPLAEKLENYLPRYLALALSVAVAAQIFCLPILLQLQDGLATYSLAANLIAEPLVAPITVLGIFACLFAPVAPWLSYGLSWLASFPAWLIKITAQTLSSWPNTSIAWPTGVVGALAGTAVIVAVLAWVFAKPIRFKNVAVITLTGAVAITLSLTGANKLRQTMWPNLDWQVVACDVGQGDAILVRSAGQIALIDVGREPKLIEKCLNNLNVTHINLLVLTHFDQDHIGGLAGALKNRKVDQALISPFEDSRWAAQDTDRILREAQIKTYEVERGTNGTLGDVEWQVLSPERGAQGAEDSNSASVVLLFTFDEFNFLAMADAPEKAQMNLASRSVLLDQPNLKSVPLVLKVSHHGSADQFAELIEAIKPEVSLISVGASNSYGHPTARTLDLLNRVGSKILRTDLSGAVALAWQENGLTYSEAGAG
jgi:competence protein ComEC